MPAESSGRQTIKKDVHDTFGITVNMGITNFNVTAPKSALPPERIRGMGWCFIDHG
jgi:hypothetical protein